MNARKSDVFSFDTHKIALFFKKRNFSRESAHRYIDETYINVDSFIARFSDEQAIEFLVKNKKSKNEAKIIVQNWREFAKNVFDLRRQTYYLFIKGRF